MRAPLLAAVAAAALLAASVAYADGPVGSFGGSSGSGGAPSGAAGGDLSGTYPDPVLDDITTATDCGDGITTGCIFSKDAKGRVTGASTYSLTSSGTVTQLNAGLGESLSPGVQGGSCATVCSIAFIAPTLIKTADYTFANGDGMGLAIMNSASPHQFTLPQATATGNFAMGWVETVMNGNSGCLTVAAVTSTISPAVPTCFAQGQAASFDSDGTNWRMVGLSLPMLTSHQILMNNTGSTAWPVGVAINDCTGAGKALTYTQSTGAIGCNTISGSSPSYGFSVSNNATALPTAATGTAFQFASADTVATVLFGNSFAASAGFIGQRANGTNASPTTLVASDAIAFLSGRGYDGTAYTSSSAGNFQIQALETWTASAHGTGLVGQCTPLLSTTIGECIKITATGLVMGSSTAAQAPRAGVDIGSNLKAAAIKSFNIDGTNSESATFGWASSIFKITTEKAGSGSVRSIELAPASSVRLNPPTGGQINLMNNSGTIFDVTSTLLEANNAAGPELLNSAASSTVPTVIPNKAASTTGIGAQASGNISEIVAGTEITRLTATGLTIQSGIIVLKGYAIGSLPTGVTGGTAYVTDANAACSYGAAPVAGGSTVCKVFYNGTAWVEG